MNCITDNKEIKLPFVPMKIGGFSHQAALFSILLAYEECKPWVCNNFIQLFAIKNLCESNRKGTLDFFYMEYNDFKSYEYTANPWIRWFEIPLNMFSENTDITVYLIDNLKLNFYSYLEIDTFYISKYDDFKKRHRIHWIYICGFDEKNSEILCFDNFSEGKFRLERIKREEIQKGYLGSYQIYKNSRDIDQEAGNIPGLGMFKIMLTAEDTSNPDVVLVNLDRIICLLKNYLGDCGEVAYIKSKYYTYGISVYDELIAFMDKKWKKTEEIDVRSFFSMKDHKTLMLWRLNYLEKCFGTILTESKAAFQELENELYAIILLILKYNISRNDNILIKIRNILLKCKEEEKEEISKLIQHLEELNTV